MGGVSKIPPAKGPSRVAFCASVYLWLVGLMWRAIGVLYPGCVCWGIDFKIFKNVKHFAAWSCRSVWGVYGFPRGLRLVVDAVIACKINLTDGIWCGYLCQLTTGTDTCMKLLTGVMDVYFWRFNCLGK